MSKQWENEKAKEIHRQTGTDIRTYRCGYSGNNAMPQPDVLITTPMNNYAVEMKGPIAGEYCRVQTDDIDQLIECTNSYTTAALVVKFQNRETLVVRFFDKASGIEAYDDLSDAEKFAALIPNEFDPRVSDAGTLMLTKPDLDSDWPSATAGSNDVDAILSGLGIPTDDSVVIA